MTTRTPPMELVLITGMSGSGKSVALNALEDVGFYCVDNLPPELFDAFIALEHSLHASRVAIAMDVRSANALPGVPRQLKGLQGNLNRPVHLTTLFLDATTDALVRRFSETRRSHPLLVKLVDTKRALVDAIEHERELLAELRERALVIDTSLIRPARLRSQVKDMVGTHHAPMTLVFESFAFKRGIPMDADFVFDVRMLPNPHYEPELKALNGLDAPVAEFLATHEEVHQMQAHIANFLSHWLPRLLQDHRSYVTVGIGCTGGQHRSVYLVEALARAFGEQWNTRVRHRESDHWASHSA